MRIILGSTAIRHHFPEFTREPKDIDVFSDIGSYYCIQGGVCPGCTSGCCEPVDTYFHPKMLQHWFKGEERPATVDELYTVKVSHSYWELPNGSWGKHVADAMFLKHHGAKLLPGLHKLLYTVWEEKYGVKKCDLTKESMDFFADAVTRKYDHDSIHESVAYGDHAKYIDALKDGASVQMDMNKVWGWSFEEQVKLFREEVYATALERIVIPRDYHVSPGAAYVWALRRTITSLTKGKSAQFLVENYDTFYRPDCDYVARHKSQMHKLIPLEAS